MVQLSKLIVVLFITACFFAEVSMETIHLPFSKTQLFVRYVQKYTVPDTKASPKHFVNAYDHRLFYVHHGFGSIEFRDRTLEVNRGDLLLWHSGVEYMHQHAQGHNLVLLGCNFDYTQAHNHLVYPIPPDRIPDFRPEQILEKIHISDIPATEAPILLHNMQIVEKELEEMLREYQTRKILFDQRLSAMLMNILAIAFRQTLNVLPEKAHSDHHIDEVIEYIHQHYAEPITNKEIGDVFSYHPNYLNKRMAQYTGETLHQYLISYRIARAIDLLTTTDESINAIAAAVGFRDICHFTRIFRQKTGQIPSAYRNRQ
jgi:AraC-like DNA-binding protein